MGLNAHAAGSPRTPIPPRPRTRYPCRRVAVHPAPLTERGQAEVDVPCLVRAQPHGPALLQTLAARQVHQVQPPDLDLWTGRYRAPPNDGRCGLEANPD